MDIDFDALDSLFASSEVIVYNDNTPDSQVSEDLQSPSSENLVDYLLNVVENIKQTTTEDVVVEPIKENENKFSVSIIHKELSNLFISHYNKERVSIEKNAISHYILYKITVHFPKILVKNSIDMEHEITDFYVYFEFGYNKEDKTIQCRATNGIRGTFTIEEFLSGYTFSHLSGSFSNWGTFCLGSSAISNKYNELRLPEKIESVEQVDNFISKVEIFLHMFNSYLEWESLEGGPYKMLSSLGTNRFRYNEVERLTVSVEEAQIAYLILTEILTTAKYREILFRDCIVNLGNSIKINMYQLTILIDDLFCEELKDENEEFVEYDPVDYSRKKVSSAFDDFNRYFDKKTLNLKESISFNFKGNSITPTITESFTIKNKEDKNLIIHPVYVYKTATYIMSILYNLKSKL